MAEKLYYLQDKRMIVGNDLSWWAKDGCGYTCDISKAHVYTEEEAFEQNSHRDTDVPWPKEYIDERVKPVIDHQRCDLKVALGSKFKELTPPWKPKYEPYKCYHCGRFLSEHDYYVIPCPNCDGHNGP